MVLHGDFIQMAKQRGKIPLYPGFETLYPPMSCIRSPVLRRFQADDDNMIVKPHPGNPTNSERNRLHFRPLLAAGAG
jgi:hypothetical protein